MRRPVLPVPGGVTAMSTRWLDVPLWLARRGGATLTALRRKPVAAALFLLGSAVVIAVPPYATFRLGDAVIAIRSIGGVSALLIGGLLAVCAVSLVVRPQYRIAAGVTAVLLSLVALATSNLGGFLLGSLLGLVGGALALAWTGEPRRPRRPWSRRRDAGPPVERPPGPAAGLCVPLLAVAVLFTGSAGATARPASGPTGPPWTLRASKVAMDGVVYHGNVDVLREGRSVPAMRFTAHTVRVTGLVQVAPLGDGRHLVISTAAGTVSEGNGGIELLATRLTGSLQVLGLVGIPVDFTPAMPPPLVPPSVVLTDVRLLNASLASGVLAVPSAGLEISRGGG